MSPQPDPPAKPTDGSPEDTAPDKTGSDQLSKGTGEVKVKLGADGADKYKHETESNAEHSKWTGHEHDAEPASHVPSNRALPRNSLRPEPKDMLGVKPPVPREEHTSDPAIFGD